MADVFDQKILCNGCNKVMKKSEISKDGFILRIMICKNCNEKVIHPVDQQDYNRFKTLKNKEFRVKMRLVGNSYAVSIPKEIVRFMKEQEDVMDDMVKVCLEEFGRISLSFNRCNHLNKDKINNLTRKDTN